MENTFKLTISFSSLATLSAFVQKMGGDVIGGEITHGQPITPDSVPADPAPAKKRGGRSTKVTTEVAPSAPVDLAPNLQGPSVGGMPFPGAPTNFAPGTETAPAPSQQLHQSAPAPQSVPSHTTMAAPQVDPVRQQWNDACGQLIGALEKTGLPQAQCDEVIQGAFRAAGCQPTRITTLTDAQIQAFYPALNAAVNQVISGMNAGMNQYR